jgi:hypothetical protein
MVCLAVFIYPRSMATHNRLYREPDAVLADAVYCYEDGGINPPRDRSSRWNARGRQNNLLRYEAIRRSRSSYQGFWEMSRLERFSA